MARHKALSQISPKPAIEEGTYERSYLSSLHNTLTGSNSKQESAHTQGSPFELTKKFPNEEKEEAYKMRSKAFLNKATVKREQEGKRAVREFTVEEIMKLIGEIKAEVRSVNEKVDRIQESVGFKLANIQAEVVLLSGKLNYIESNTAFAK
eukprot:TRINITY_DN12067_c0_g1_i1.p3 TRINITY_DN12067_c0_g1~~TRINITY_DN12067_c0_g1_i1.p3  ORF type:complete len:151 (+),score=46.00 TRINITY_DN12067_c0_g1_i1:508-960(+)